ncbi:MAG: molybdenum cofactor guanylyltransferase [Anaerovoracaceae bacterium]
MEAVIIAGGKSTRMGFDKQFLSKGDKSIFERNLPLLQRCFSKVRVITNRPELYEEYAVETNRDVIPGFGPLSGLHSALVHSEEEYCYALACDMPILNEDYIAYIKGIVSAAKPDACVSRCGLHIEPFHGVYGKGALPVIEADLLEEKASVKKSLEKVNTFYISEEITRSFTPDWSLFMNLNTKEDYERFLVG